MNLPKSMYDINTIRTRNVSFGKLVM